MARVVTSDAAVSLIGQLQRQIQQLQEQLQEMLRTGNDLASPQVWEGTAANQFREGEWAQTRAWADRSVAQLQELSTTIQRINDNIQAAGGGLG